MYLVKTSSSRELSWQRTFGGSGWEVGRSVQQTSDGGYVVCGQTSSFGAGGQDVYLVKTLPSGELQWERTFGGGSSDRGHSVQQTSDGGYVVGGGTRSFGAGGSDVYLMKLAPESPSAPRFLRGDCNGDGTVEGQVTDAVFLLSYNFLGGPRPPCLAACDANGDGKAEGQVTDAVYLLTFNFLGGLRRGLQSRPLLPIDRRLDANTSTPREPSLGATRPFPLRGKPSPLSYLVVQLVL